VSKKAKGRIISVSVVASKKIKEAKNSYEKRLEEIQRGEILVDPEVLGVSQKKEKK
jgi:hypothetical protein